MSIQRGQVLLFKGAKAWTEKMIVWATRGEYYHVAIAISDKEVIEATGSGISIGPAPTNPDAYDAIDLTSYTTQTGIDTALVWAIQQKGKQYGWADIAFQALKFIWPTNPLRFGIEGHHDCSDFACRYLIHAEVPLPDDYLDTYTVTPNDLGRWAGLPRSSRKVVA